MPPNVAIVLAPGPAEPARSPARGDQWIVTLAVLGGALMATVDAIGPVAAVRYIQGTYGVTIIDARAAFSLYPLGMALTGALSPWLTAASPAMRAEVAPLNPPAPGTSEDLRRAARDASTGAFRLAMLVAAVLLFGGAAINGAGIRTLRTERAAQVVSPDPSWRRCTHISAGAPPGAPPPAGRATLSGST